jgi:PKD repeat protein
LKLFLTEHADSWSWTFGTGDGSALQHPVYTYTTPGQYTVTLNITDTDSGETAELTRTNYITVTPRTLITTSRTISYTYDGMYRLTGAYYSSGENFSYDYDKVGNRQ